MTIKQSTSIVIQMKKGNYWAEIYIKPWNRGNGFALTIRSDFGNWSYVWGAPGEGGYKSFLPELDISYAYGKFVGREVFDSYEFLNDAKKLIIHERRSFGLNEEEARTAWDDLIEACDNFDNPADYLYYHSESEFWSDQSCFSGLGFVMDKSFVKFWDVFWKPFCDYISSKEVLPVIT